ESLAPDSVITLPPRVICAGVTVLGTTWCLTTSPSLAGLRREFRCAGDSAAKALLTGTNKVNDRMLFSSSPSAAILIAELNTDTCRLPEAAVAVRWPLMAPKLPAPCPGIKPQRAPMCAVADGVRLDKGTGGEPVGDAEAGGDVPQPTAAGVSSSAPIKATPKEAWERITSLPARLPRNPANQTAKKAPGNSRRGNLSQSRAAQRHPGSFKRGIITLASQRFGESQPGSLSRCSHQARCLIMTTTVDDGSAEPLAGSTVTPIASPCLSPETTVGAVIPSAWSLSIPTGRSPAGPMSHSS